MKSLINGLVYCTDFVLNYRATEGTGNIPHSTGKSGQQVLLQQKQWPYSSRRIYTHTHTNQTTFHLLILKSKINLDDSVSEESVNTDVLWRKWKWMR